MKRQNAHYEFIAALQGVDLKGKGEIPRQEDFPTTTTTDERTPRQLPLFGDPATDYNHLSDEEKEEKTKQMMNHFKGVMSRTPLGG